MAVLERQGKSYEVDGEGFLVDPASWDEGFVEAAADRLGMPVPLSKDHWHVIKLIRDVYLETGRCPIVFEVCRLVGLRQKDLNLLFPAGYLRGACKLAGVTYREGYLRRTHWPIVGERSQRQAAEKVYRVDVRGFLIDAADWDEYYAVHRAYETSIPGGSLSDRHWSIIKYLRRRYEQDQSVPTVYETCDAFDLSLEELEKLFPDGYHRGAVKIAGLRVR